MQAITPAPVTAVAVAVAVVVAAACCGASCLSSTATMLAPLVLVVGMVASRAHSTHCYAAASQALRGARFSSARRALLVLVLLLVLKLVLLAQQCIRKYP
jgi:hypothetical protein